MISAFNKLALEALNEILSRNLLRSVLLQDNWNLVPICDCIHRLSGTIILCFPLLERAHILIYRAKEQPCSRYKTMSLSAFGNILHNRFEALPSTPGPTPPPFKPPWPPVSAGQIDWGGGRWGGFLSLVPHGTMIDCFRDDNISGLQRHLAVTGGFYKPICTELGICGYFNFAYNKKICFCMFYYINLTVEDFLTCLACLLFFAMRLDSK